MPEQLELFHFKGPLERITVQEGFELLWKYHLRSKPSARTYQSNRKAWVRSIGHRYMDTVTFIDVERHKGDRLKTLGLGSVFHDHGLIHLLFSKAAEWRRRKIGIDGLDFSYLKLPAENPTTGVRKKKPPPRRVTITPEQFSRLVEHSTERLKESIYFALDNAMRPSDLDRLGPKDWNPSTGRLEFIQSKTGKLQTITPSNRQFKVIQRVLKRSEMAFLDPKNRRKEFETARAKAGLPWLQFRDLRKTSIDETIQFTGSIIKGQGMAGHTSPRTTEDHYNVSKGSGMEKEVRHLEKKFVG